MSILDKPSMTDLMVAFHKLFKAGARYGGQQPAASTAEAMRQAAMNVMQNPEYAHPFYWAGFVMVCDAS